MLNKYLTILFIICALFGKSYSQEITIKFDKKQVALNETFTISIVAKNTTIDSYSGFPQIENFQRLGISSGNSYRIINGQTSSEHKITQNYRPNKEGRFQIAPFKITVNGKEIASPGITVQVLPARQRQRRNPFSMFDDMYAEEEEFIEIEDNAFYSVRTDKKEIYRGEGLTVTGSIYIPVELSGLFALPNNFGEQLLEVNKKLTPRNCWEERFEMTSQQEQVKIKGKEFIKVMLFQSEFFPYTTDDIEIPRTEIDIIKYQVSNRRTFFGRNKKETSKKLYSKKLQIKVNDLPDHPLKNAVPVGDYRLAERIDKGSVQTNEAINYTFKIYGRGNINSINNPETQKTDKLAIFSPNTLQNIERASGHISGEKIFSYDIIPQEPGEYNLEDYISWIYFNPKRGVYDTLKASASFTVTGQSLKNENIKSNNFGSFYDNMDEYSNEVSSINQSDSSRTIINIALLAILSCFAILLYRQKKEKNG